MLLLFFSYTNSAKLRKSAVNVTDIALLSFSDTLNKKVSP